MLCEGDLTHPNESFYRIKAQTIGYNFEVIRHFPGSKQFQPFTAIDIEGYFIFICIEPTLSCLHGNKGRKI